ncbi:Na+/H+ antiporter NhaA [Salibacter sp.]|uniref:Na+/H+ antiporter NhaA n=1 Tax=Salibacter sp. TaxID=2010995 RepID=UPI00287082DA|nr:Na+/H+ antiporter NhaA [Salibacter sp.]MDR9488206.1 Na+/H+ antiporter NhaA [Salibacter sp.]
MKRRKRLAVAAKRFISTFEDFSSAQALSGVILILCMVVAMIWANSDYAHYYHELWETKFTIGFEGAHLTKDLHHWINDGLMAMFFFTVGLEIKREVMVGELSNKRKAILPVVAAIGGMAVPALIFIMFNSDYPEHEGWGIPMATDIAFTLGVMSLLGKRVPLSLKVFLTALAIADDLGAVLVIALFYSSNISLVNFGIAVAFLAVMVGANMLGVRKKTFYAVVGIGGLWTAFLLSGIHATVAGVVAALAIPTDSAYSLKGFRERIKTVLIKAKAISPLHHDLLSFEEQAVVTKVKKACKNYEPPLQTLEHNLNPWVIYFVMPMFTLANAGVTLPDDPIAMMGDSLSLGVGLGLLLGKPIGIVGLSLIAIKLKLADLPKGVNWQMMVGAGLLAGIGFTMSMFISELAFEKGILEDTAKMGILLGSFVAGVAGFIILKKAIKNKEG